MTLRQGRLELHERVGGGGGVHIRETTGAGLLSGVLDERQEPLDERPVLCADLRVLVFTVVGLIR